MWHRRLALECDTDGERETEAGEDNEGRYTLLHQKDRREREALSCGWEGV